MISIHFFLKYNEYRQNDRRLRVMTIFNIIHHTTYRYDRPVGLGPHRLMLRPRDGRELRVLSCELTIAPEPKIAWSDDVFGNAVAVATFTGDADTLAITCRSRVEQLTAAWPVFPIAASAISFPFRYADDDIMDLGALATAARADPEGRLQNWTRAFIRGERTDTLSLLKDISAGISSWVSYEVRDDEGVQAPLATLARGQGSCRDYATLYVEAVRILGLGARVVSGYLCNVEDGIIGSAGSGSTHAWAEVFLPGAGWITFDPTNRSVGGASLIAVGVGRELAQVMPISGHYIASAPVNQTMDVRVEVTLVNDVGPVDS
jgi:transglutaminase-like putative cysteine protease